ncbi:MAG TPA: FIST C-terminal domain-containing protein [Patescibacteria group bacterium]|nr:FIST C-terminal domain-containing protein [Patescibacteria group bacterium]
MTLFASNRFASASAAGTDWRDAARRVLEQLEKARLPASNIGFLYITGELVDEAASILDLFRSVTKVEHWLGAAGAGVLGTGISHIGQPAISAMIGYIAADDFCVSPAASLDSDAHEIALDRWLEAHYPMLVLVHGAPDFDVDAQGTLAAIERRTSGFLAGGISSSRKPVLFADGVDGSGFSGAVFSQNVAVATALTQGCAPLGPVHTVTRCEDHVLMELDGQRASDVFLEDLRALGGAGMQECDAESLIGRFRGDVHIAFPVSGSDQRDYLVRNALGVDPERGWIALAQPVANGDKLLFVHRDGETMRADLSRMLTDLRARLTRERGSFAPAGALYISCVARMQQGFSDSPGSEMELVREIIGDAPLAGFYAAGEISNSRLYGYTAVLILFL